MSSKSKKRQPEMSMRKAVDNALVIFLWGYCNVHNPTPENLEILRKEIFGVRESIGKGALTIQQLRKALKDDYDLEVT